MNYNSTYLEQKCLTTAKVSKALIRDGRGQVHINKTVAQELTNSKSSDQDPNHVCILRFFN